MILACKNIVKTYGIETILENITFQIEENSKVAVIGSNGAGKSTLFKIITQEIEADQGRVIISPTISIGYLSQHTDLKSSHTILEEATMVFQDLLDIEKKLRQLEREMKTKSSHNLQGIMKDYDDLQHEFTQKNGYAYQSQIRGILKGLGFEEEEFSQPIETLSGGQKTRVALAKLLLGNPDILLLDEPTNHLDILAIEWLEEFLKYYKGTVLIISHDRYFLDQIVNQVIQIENGISTSYNGNYSTFVEKKERNLSIQLKHYEEQQREIQHQEDVIQQLKSFNREKSVKRARSREKQLEKMDKLNKPVILNQEMKFTLSPMVESGKEVLAVNQLAKSFDEKNLFSDLSFTIFKGDKVALIGDNGTGKTTLFRLIMKLLEPDGGNIIYGSRVNIAYYDQEQQNLSLQKTIFQEIFDAFPTLTHTTIRNTLAAFLFTGDDVYKKIESLSGGEKGRVSLAKIMLSKANFLLLDEPTNHLDMVSKEILESALSNYTGTILYISHDRYFINKTADKIFSLNNGTIETYLGNYDYYIEKKMELEKDLIGHNQINSETDNKIQWKENKELQAQLRRKKNEFEEVEGKIMEVEEKIKELDQLLCSEKYYTDPKKSQEIFTKKTDLEQELESLYHRWETLSHEIL